MKKVLRLLCLGLCLTLLLGLLTGCGAGSPEETENRVPGQQEFAADTGGGDEEIKKAIELGFVPDELRDDYDLQINYGEFCSILDCFVSGLYPELLPAWEEVSGNYRQSDEPMCRMEGALVLFYAAECLGLDACGYEYNIPLEDYTAPEVDFYQGVDWDYPLLPEIFRPYYNETLANSENYSWRCGLDYADNAKRFVEYNSYGNGKTFFDYDESYSLNLGSPFERGDAIRAVERLYENARFFMYEPSAELQCSLSPQAMELAAAMPEVSWQQLPDWKGCTVAARPWCASYGIGMLYQQEEIEALGSLGFDFIRAPLDFNGIFEGTDTGKANPAFLENMDRLLEYCALEGIHVCFDLHDMPGFNTGGDDSLITLWSDGETQELFVEFWRFMAEYYRDVPSGLLSFNLLNEPHGNDGEPSDQVYSQIMLRAVEAIREVNPDRLIFADMLGVTQGIPVQGLADAQVAQAFHPYFLSGGVQSWPVNVINGFVHRDNGILSLSGSFPAGSSFTLKLSRVHGSSLFRLEADGLAAAELAAGTEAQGENGCTGVYEAGTGGEWRSYEGLELSCTLDRDCGVLRLIQEEGCWYQLERISISTPDYSLSISCNGSVVTDERVPDLLISDDGQVSAVEEGVLITQSGDWLEESFREYADFREQTGCCIMAQEFGFNETIDYQAGLKAAEDLLSVLEGYDIPWCSWYGNFGPLMDERDYQWSMEFEGYSLKKEGAEYEMVSQNLMLDTGMMEVFRKYMD